MLSRSANLSIGISLFKSEKPYPTFCSDAKPQHLVGCQQIEKSLRKNSANVLRKAIAKMRGDS